MIRQGNTFVASPSSDDQFGESDIRARKGRTPTVEPLTADEWRDAILSTVKAPDALDA
jgi:hypothetical protein